MVFSVENIYTYLKYLLHLTHYVFKTSPKINIEHLIVFALRLKIRPIYKQFHRKLYYFYFLKIRELNRLKIAILKFSQKPLKPNDNYYENSQQAFQFFTETL